MRRCGSFPFPIYLACTALGRGLTQGFLLTVLRLMYCLLQRQLHHPQLLLSSVLHPKSRHCAVAACLSAQYIHR